MSWRWRWRVADEDKENQCDNVVPLLRAVQKECADVPRTGKNEAVESMIELVRDAVRESEISPEGRDTAAENDEVVFKKRFGFSVNAAQRKSIFALKREADLTDDEICLLKRSGSLRYDHYPATIDAPRSLLIYGLLMMAVTFVFAVYILLKTGFGELKTLTLIPIPIAMVIGLVYLIVLIDKQYVRPYRIARRVKESARCGFPDWRNPPDC